MNIYFAGSIRGGRDHAQIYPAIINALREYGEVFTEHVGNDQMLKEEKSLTDVEIFERDVHWLRQSDVIVAEVTQPSLGVGYELALAESLGKRVICLFDKTAGTLSAMLAGNKSFEVIDYTGLEELLQQLSVLLKG